MVEPRDLGMSYQPIENHGLVGDLQTAALVGMDGSIDFMCYPHFDSPSIFAALLEPENGGEFKIAPEGVGSWFCTLIAILCASAINGC
jgi:GH15 family glucan-1,4-alpha-glucosidase